MKSKTLALVGGTCIVPDPSGKWTEAQVDILVEDGRIREIGAGLAAKAERAMKCSGLHILPGAIDPQVHFREPGLTHKEDLATG